MQLFRSPSCVSRLAINYAPFIYVKSTADSWEVQNHAGTASLSTRSSPYYTPSLPLPTTSLCLLEALRTHILYFGLFARRQQ